MSVLWSDGSESAASAAGPAHPEFVNCSFVNSPPPTTVVCLRGRRDDPGIVSVIYVGRPMYRGGWRLAGHPLANPFRIGRDGTAEVVVARYRRWLLARPGLRAELAALRGRRLGCWCPGPPCHAWVIAEEADAIAA